MPPGNPVRFREAGFVGRADDALNFPAEIGSDFDDRTEQLAAPLPGQIVCSLLRHFDFQDFVCMGLDRIKELPAAVGCDEGVQRGRLLRLLLIADPQ